MKKLLLIFLSFFALIEMEAQITLSTIKNYKNISITIPILKDSVQQKDNERKIGYCIEYIHEYFPNTSFPLFIVFNPKWNNDFKNSLTYDSCDGNAITDSDERLLEMKNAESESNKLGIKIYTENNNLENLLKLIDYGIKNEKRLRKQFWKIRKNERISVTDEKSLVIEGKYVQNILDKDPGNRIKRFLKEHNLE